MKVAIETARDQHRVMDEIHLRDAHARFIARQQASGLRSVVIHESAEPVTARINHGVWVFDCDCGAGVAADPDFSVACCFGCGAIHTAVVFPSEEERLNIEHVLLSRPRTENRNWDPKENLITLLSDNGEHGVKLKPPRPTPPPRRDPQGGRP
jgi:hypothetical protein